MKTEVFMSMAPGLGGTTTLHSLTKIPEDAVTFLLLDTPQNTPVGTPESDVFVDETSEQVVENAEPELSVGPVQRTAPKPIQTPKSTENRRRRKKKRTKSPYEFSDLYDLTGEVLGEGAYGSVRTCIEKRSGKEYAVKIILKTPGRSRERVFREIEIYHQCRDHPNVIQLVQFFEDDDKFLLVLEKVNGGTLIKHIQRKIRLSEREVSMIIRDIANALMFLHQKGISHRDIKPENVLCFSEEEICPIKICDFDLGSGVHFSSHSPCNTPELLSPVGSADYMAPEVVMSFLGEASPYDKRCDLWSLGVIMYILLCGYAPFYGGCGADCGWEDGKTCAECQSMLFDRIQSGAFRFPEREWARISDDAKDIISHLLVKDASQRYSAEMVFNHPWVANGGPDTALATPDVILRNDSARNLAQFAENANAIKRQHNPFRSLESPRPASDQDESSSPCSSVHFSFSPLSDSSLYNKLREIL